MKTSNHLSLVPVARYTWLPAPRSFAFRAPESDLETKHETGIRPNRKALQSMTGLAAVALLAAGVADVQAQTVWDGYPREGKTRDWHTADNWSDGVPAAGVDANIFTPEDVVEINQAATAGNISVVAAGIGERPVLNIAADVTAGRIQVGRDLASNVGDGYVEHTAGNLVLSGESFSIRVGDDPGGEGEYRMTGGTLDAAGRFYVGYHTSAVAGGGTFHLDGGDIIARNLFYIGQHKNAMFNMSRGTLTTTATTDGNFSVGRSSGTGTFNMSGGTLNNSNRMRVGFGGTSTGKFVMTGGTVNTLDIEIGRDGTAQGEFIVRGGELNVTRTFVILGRGSDGVSGVFIKYGAANVVFDLANANPGQGWWVGWNNSSGHGTFRAVVDRTGYSPIDFQQGDLVLERDGATSVLQVGLDGGVMLSGTNSFDLVTMGDGEITGNWTEVPGQLWTQTTDSDGVSIELDTDYLRGTLNASATGNSATLTGPSSVGYIEVSNFDSAKQLRLDLVPASVGGSNLDDFVADLATAGYSPLVGGNLVVISLDPALNGAEYFAWDLSAYTHNDVPLEIEAITVVTAGPPRIAEFHYNPADGSAEATIVGALPNTRFKLVEASDLDFSNPDQDPVPLLGATVGTLFDGIFVFTDENGEATVQFNLGTGPATFVRAEQVGTITLASFDFEAGGEGFIPTGDWEWGTPASDAGAVGQVIGGNGGSTGAWATKLGDGGDPVDGGISEGTESVLTSPGIDLTGITGARLEFAAVVDAKDGDELEIRVLDASDNLLGDPIIPFPDGFPTTVEWNDLGPFNLPEAANDKTIRLQFYFRGYNEEYLGFYLDDVIITF